MSFRFETGAVGSHVHTWVGDGWRNEMLLSGQKRLYRLNLGQRTLTVMEGQDVRTYDQEADSYAYENDMFIDMVTTGDWDRNPSEYSDALATLKLTLACDAALQGVEP